MSFDTCADRSVCEARILFELDITQLNTQWVNAGAGVWAVNEDALYPWVDSSLLTGFTAQTISNVGSVAVDSIQMVEASTLLSCSNNVESFYWDGSTLYVHVTDNDPPWLHTIIIGVIYGYSKEGFAPVGSNTFYESRLLAVPSISKARDPLFFGKLQYEGGTVQLNNGDGGLDTLAETNDVYGNQARVSLGFADLDISEYERLFTGYVETLSVDEERCEVSFKDKRKQLTKQITYTCSVLNAIDAIQEILLDNYSIPYNALYYDTTAWEIARAKAYSVTINMQESDATIDVIQNICESTFGIFVVDSLGRYSFKVIRPGDAAEYIIMEDDILNHPRAVYDPSEVITSTRIGYAKDWTKSEASAYTYLTDTTQEAAIYAKYKTYNQRTFNTLLPTLAAAQTFSDMMLLHSGTVRPTMEIEVPIKYYAIEVGDFAEVTVNRANATWFGERKCEVISKQYNLDRNTITFGVRKYGAEISYRITTDGYYRLTTEDELRKVGA